MTTALPYVALGGFDGVLSGLIGVGGGVVIVPVLAFLFGMSQHQAEGTTLALLVPLIGILAAWTYSLGGYVHLHAAARDTGTVVTDASRILRITPAKRR